MSLRIGVILNLSAGPLQETGLRQRIQQLLSRPGVELEIHSAADGFGLRAAALSQIEKGCDVLVAAGGDGTVSGLAALLVRSQMTLGVLPTGTLNHFARDLGIPADLGIASRIILTGHSAMVDVGEVNGRFFVNNSSLGLYPSIVRRREHWERTGTSRLLAFAAAILFVLRRYPFLDVHLCVDGTRMFRRSPFIFIGNNEYEVEGLRLGSRTDLNGGALALYTANRTGRGGLVLIALSALFKRLKRNRDFEILMAHELLVETRRKRVAVALDGEVVRLAPPLRYSILPGALRVLVPHGAAQSASE